MAIWNEKADQIRVDLLKQNKTYREIANDLNNTFSCNDYTEDAVRGRCRRTNSTRNNIDESIQDITFEDRWNIFCEYIGQRKTDIAKPEKPSDCSHTLVISDLHVPHCNLDVLSEVVETNKKKARRCVVDGDFMDAGSFSPHFAFKEVHPRDEIQAAKTVAKYLNNSFDEVIYVLGNHETWYNKSKAKIPAELRFLLKDYLIEYVIADLEKSHFTPNFYYQIGDCILGHPSMFMKRRLQDALASYNYFNQWQTRLGLRDIRCYVHAHTHRLGSLYVEDDGKMVKIFESGCLCNPSENISLGHVVSYAPPTEGYVIISQDDTGVTDFNDSREFQVPSMIKHSVF